MPRWDVGEEPVAGYKLVDFLGRGGFGEVWLAEAPGGIQCALKIIDLISPDSAKELKALRLMKRLRHPHLVPITAFWIRDRKGNVLSLDELHLNKSGGGQLSELLMCMGLGEKSLSKRLEEVNPPGTPAGMRVGLPADELLRYMEGAAKGIDYLNQPDHKLGEGDAPIIHCDIKPGNLLVVADESQVCDYGLARAITQDVRRVSMAGGTPAYSPPELLGNKPSSATDQYSLAITYHELRTGCLPFPDDLSLTDIYRIHAEDRLDFTHEVLTPRERDVLRRATRSRPADRFPNCRKFVDELKSAVLRSPSGTVSASALTRAVPAPPAGKTPGVVAVPPDRPHTLTPRAVVTPRGTLLEQLREGGKPIPGYTLAQLVATDSTGQTWQAMDKADRLRVLRIILQPSISDPAAMTALDTVRRTEHDHLARLYEFCFVSNQCEPIAPDAVRRSGPAPAALVLAAEDCVRTLADRLTDCQEKEGRVGIPEDELIRYVREVGLALEMLAAGRPPVLHLRLRPDVIGLTRHGSIKLLDAGVAPFVPASELRTAAAFAPPEVLEGTPSGRSDPYALSLVYYKLRTGRMPFAETLDIRRQRELKQRAGFEWSLVTPGEQEVLTRATSPDPGDRFASARMFADALTGVFQPAAVPAFRDEQSFSTQRAYPQEVEPGRPSQRETPKPSQLYETPRKSDVPPAAEYRELQAVPPVMDDDGTLTPGLAPAQPAPVAPRATPRGLVSKPVPPPKPVPAAKVETTPRTGRLVSVGVAAGLLLAGGTYFAVFHGGGGTTANTGNGTTPTTSRTTPTKNTLPTESEKAWLKAEPEIERLIGSKLYADAVVRIDRESGAPADWKTAQRTKVYDKWVVHLKAVPDDQLLVQIPKLLEKYPGDAWGTGRLNGLRVAKLRVPDFSGVKTRADARALVEAARKAGEPVRAEVGEAEWAKFDAALTKARTDRMKQLFVEARTAYLATLGTKSPDANTAFERFVVLKDTGTGDDAAEVEALTQFMEAFNLEREPTAKPEAVAAVVRKLVAAAKDEKIKPHLKVLATRLAGLGTAHKSVRGAIEAGFPEAGRPEELTVAVAAWKKELTTAGMAMTEAFGKLDAAMNAKAIAPEDVRSAIKEIQTQVAKLDADPELQKFRDDATLFTSSAKSWLDSSAGSPGDLLAKLGVKDGPYRVPLLKEAFRQCGAGKLELAKVRVAKAAAAVPKDRTAEVDAAFQSTLALLVSEELRKSKPDVSKIVEAGDTALGWKSLAEADAKLGDPATSLTAAVRAEVEAAVSAAREFKLPTGVSRPGQAAFDEMGDYLLWAADVGTADPAASADKAVKLVSGSEVWTSPRKARAARAVRSAALSVKPRDRKDVPYLGPVYDPNAARKAKGWLEKADEWGGKDESTAGVQALIYDSAGESSAAKAAAAGAKDSFTSLRERVRLGLLKAEAAKERKDDAGVTRATAEVAWEAVEWLHGEVNKVGADPPKWADQLQAFRQKLPAVTTSADVRIKAAAMRLEILRQLSVIGTPKDELKKNADAYLAAFGAAADGSTGGDKAKYLAWKAYVRYLRLYDKSVWTNADEWKALWADLDAAKAADPINADAAWVRALVRFLGFEDFDPARAKVLFATAKKAGTAEWGDRPEEFAFRRRLFDDIDLALAGLRDRADGQFRYLAARARFQTVLRYDVDLRRPGAASVLAAGLSEVSDALDQKFPDAARARHLRAMLNEDFAWIGTSDVTTARDHFQKAIDELSGLTALKSVGDLTPEDVLLDLGRVRVRRMLFAAAAPGRDDDLELRRCLASSGASEEVKATAHYWLGRIAYHKQDWKAAEDELTKAEKCQTYRADRDLYLELSKAQGDHTKLKWKGKLPVSEPERSAFLASATNLFGVAGDLSVEANRQALVEGLDLFPWRMPSAYRAKLLLAVAKESAGQEALRTRIRSILDRDGSAFDPTVMAEVRRAVGQ